MHQHQADTGQELQLMLASNIRLGENVSVILVMLHFGVRWASLSILETVDLYLHTTVFRIYSGSYLGGKKSSTVQLTVDCP